MRAAEPRIGSALKAHCKRFPQSLRCLPGDPYLTENLQLERTVWLERTLDHPQGDTKNSADIRLVGANLLFCCHSIRKRRGWDETSDQNFVVELWRGRLSRTREGRGNRTSAHPREGMNGTVWLEWTLDHPRGDPKKSTAIRLVGSNLLFCLREGFLVPGSMARTPALTQFRGQQGMALLDGTNPVARTWLNRKLRALTKKYNITNFVLDAGSAKNVPPGAKFRNGLENPDQHVIDLAQALTNGTNLLAVYPPIENSTACALILQDSTKPDVARRLLRRVLELNSFNYTCYLPALSYSFYELIKDPALSHRYQQLTKFLAFRPWIYNEDTLTPVTSPMGDKRFRKEIRFARILPMWVISSSKDAYKIDDQFVLGPSLFIAPILDSTNTRRIFVPEGRWKDSSNMVHNGPKWIEEYWAGWEVPFFIRVEKRERTKYGW
ncbi:unnamed protein product [Cyprideis torosa]|uniref:Glycosyl hydrolase family 31 C-terminal domain-containing protein n=1 Tax=Cyprideis torosa TaxID=163714 RepID=A0A7R8ZK25_9CRUS|nr:unnamed protein product [Cyprideis torosa]CAG0880848.1 unnamed protein product [Cyprideis torosa]